MLVQNQQQKHQKTAWNIFKVNNKYTRKTSLTSLITLNYFTNCIKNKVFHSISDSCGFGHIYKRNPIFDFDQVNVYWENYLTFYLFWCARWKMAELTKKQCRKFRYFSYFTHLVKCNLSKPSITQKHHSRNTKSLYKCDHQTLET